MSVTFKRIEMERYKILVETREITFTHPKTGAKIIYQPKQLMFFKRYGKDENEVRNVLKEQLLPYYGTDYDIRSIEIDKTKPVS